MASLLRIEGMIRSSDGDAIHARWEFGREVLARRQGKQLPPGLSAAICEQAGISQMEMSRRVRVAEAYDEEELNRQSLSCDWTAIVKGVPKKRATPRKATESRAAPTAAMIKEADRVEALISHRGVASVLMARDRASEGTRKAQAAIARKERGEARQQKQDDELAQQVQSALRQGLVQGDANWQNFTEQMEIFADTVKRYLDFIDALPAPDELRLKRLESQLSQLQQGLLDFRTRLWPDYSKRSSIGKTTGVIDVHAIPRD